MTLEEFLKTFPPLVKSYRPNSDLLKSLRGVSLLMIVGPSGVGKTTLIHRSGVAYVPSDATRDPRPDEVDGIDYRFRHDYAKILQDMKTGQFIQVAIGSGGDFYATKISSFPESDWATLAIVADVIPIFRALGFKKTLTAFITPPNYEEWIRRMSIHPATDEQRVKRLAEGRRSYQFAVDDKETHIILNDQLPLADQQLRGLINGETDKERESKGREAAHAILKQLG